LFRIAVRKYPPFEEAIRTQWGEFEAKAQTGLTLDLVALELHALEEALFSSNGLQDGDWDVAFVATDWISAMHELNCALDLAPLIAADAPEDYPEGWTDSLLRLQRIGDAVLGVPYHDGPECLIYRRDLFEDRDLRGLYKQKFGKDLELPLTWLEFHRIARFLHQPERGLYGTVFAAFPDGHNSVYDFLLQLWTRGGDLLDSAGRVRFDTREAADALAFYRAIVADKEAVHPDCRTLDSVGAGLEFAAGRVAMMVNWFGFATMAHTSPDSTVRGRVGVADIPHQGTGTTVSLNVYWILSIGAGSAHQRQAWSFLRHVLTPAMDKLTTMSGAIGCRRSTWSDEEINAAIPFYRHIEQLHASAREIPRRPDWPRIAAIIDRLVTANITTTAPVQELLRQADADLATR
jgi:multiple sugar transport system substrate-binding protein